MAGRKVRKVKGTTSGPTVGSGRTTPKGTTPGGRAPEASMRYTPPTVRLDKPSPRIVPVLMFVLLLAGAVVIVVNYMGLLPTESGEASNWYLLLGLGLISGGFVTATQYR
ncbi:MAG: cell division protein CrgA [Actinomycetota bacterium]|nr:cell division protein CrgA [Actinomycetota bacterium]